MSGNIPFRCPQCGGETFNTTTEPETESDIPGAVCANCGHVVTEDDIRSQAEEIANGVLRDAIRKLEGH